MFAEVAAVRNRIEQTENVLASGSVEAIQEHRVGGAVVGRQFDLGIVDNDFSCILDSKFAANLHWDF